MKDIDTRALMGEAKFYEGYSRWDEQLDRYETWEESVARVMNMHREFYKDKMSDELSQLINEAESLYKLKYVLGAQRALQFGGEQLQKHHMRIFNCVSSYADRPEFFGELFYVLLCMAPETKIKTSKGLKMIKDIEVGDMVLSFNEETREYEFKEVYNVIENPTANKQKLEIELDNGHTIRCTVDHKFLTSNRGWVEAQDLEDDDDIVNMNELGLR